MTFLCYRCIDHQEFQEYSGKSAHYDDCDGCGSADSFGINLPLLAKTIDPIIKKYFSKIHEYPMRRAFGDDFDLHGLLREIFGRKIPFEDEIAEKLKADDRNRFKDKDRRFYDDQAFYRKHEYADIREQVQQWNHALEESKYSYRFFSPAVHELFSRLFDGVENMVTDKGMPITLALKIDTALYRARKFISADQRKEFESDPARHLGPVPSQYARSNRMSPEKVSYLYVSLERDTCCAELRPAIGEHIMTAEFTPTRELYLFDFRRLEKADFGRKSYSCFHPEYRSQQTRRALLRHLHTLISMPIVSGQEDDYLITQMMAEYLAHVHDPAFDGVVFRSSQRVGGTNVVIFPSPYLNRFGGERFKVQYKEDSLQVFKIDSIRYDISKLPDARELWLRSQLFSDMDDDIPF